MYARHADGHVMLDYPNRAIEILFNSLDELAFSKFPTYSGSLTIPEPAI